MRDRYNLLNQQKLKIIISNVGKGTGKLILPYTAGTVFLEGHFGNMY